MIRRGILAGLAAASLGRAAIAETWPARPVRIIVPFPPGGTVDILGRLTAAWLTEATGQSFVVENRSGAGGNIGAAAVARAMPDGYTLHPGDVLLTGTPEGVAPVEPGDTMVARVERIGEMTVRVQSA